VISARALAPLTELFRLAQPFWQPETLGLFLKGRDADKEIAAAREGWSFELELKPSSTDPAGRIVCVRNLSARVEPRRQSGGEAP
jgi:16S rRNA (guanine527-N7)-methyltransferase